MSLQGTYRNYEDGGSGDDYWRALYRYRYFCLNLVASDIRTRFRRSRLGVLWAVIQPMGFALIIAYVWQALFERSFGEFALYVLSGFVVWDFFSTSINMGLYSLINGEGYLRQSRLPFLILQVRVPLTGAVIFLLGMAGFLILQALMGEAPPLGPTLILLPLYVPLVVLLVTPLSIIFSVLGTQFRDLQYITSLAIQALFFASPIIADRQLFDAPRLEAMSWANPIVPLLDLFRDPAMYGHWWQPYDLGVVAVWAALLWAAAFTISSFFGRRLVYSL